MPDQPGQAILTPRPISQANKLAIICLRTRGLPTRQKLLLESVLIIDSRIGANPGLSVQASRLLCLRVAIGAQQRMTHSRIFIVPDLAAVGTAKHHEPGQDLEQCPVNRRPVAVDNAANAAHQPAPDRQSANGTCSKSF